MLMSWRTRRQVLVAFIILLPFVVSGIFVVTHFTPTATCFDNKQNQGEVDVDCGGPCGPCELKKPQALNVFWSRAAQVRPGVYDVAAQIENPNQVLSSADVAYEFLLTDEFGTIAERTGSTIIFPKQRRYVIETGIDAGRTPKNVEFRVLNITWQSQKISVPQVIVENRKYAVATDKTRTQGVVEATLYNSSSFDLKEVEVYFLVLDKSENLIAVNKILVSNFLSNTRQTVRSLWPNELQGDVATIEVDPIVNIFDPSIILPIQNK